MDSDGQTHETRTEKFSIHTTYMHISIHFILCIIQNIYLLVIVPSAAIIIVVMENFPVGTSDSKFKVLAVVSPMGTAVVGAEKVKSWLAKVLTQCLVWPRRLEIEDR